MTTIPCPQCYTGVIVSPAQVGTEISCATCGQSILVTPPPPAAGRHAESRPKEPETKRRTPNTTGVLAIAVCMLGCTLAMYSTALHGATIAAVTACVVVTIIGTQMVRRIEMVIRLLNQTERDQTRP